MESQILDRRTRGFPLVALFLLIAIAAMVIAQLSLLRDAGIPTSNLFAVAIPSGVVGAVFGLIVGLHDLRRARGAAVGMLIGTLVGALSGPIALSANARPGPAIVLATATGFGLLVMTTVYRRANMKDPVQ